MSTLKVNALQNTSGSQLSRVIQTVRAIKTDTSSFSISTLNTHNDTNFSISITPTVSTNNSSSFLKLPYFFEISESSDFTLSPRFYDNNRTIFQGEYRLLTKNSDHIIDASINNKDSFISKKKKSMSHFFSKFPPFGFACFAEQIYPLRFMVSPYCCDCMSAT